MSTLVKFINIPAVKPKYDSDTWDLIGSDAFSKLRTGREALTESELRFLRREFTKFIEFAEQGDHSYDGRSCVPKNENITIEMMRQASYELTKLAARA